MNKKFHRIMVDGETYYRELDCGEVVGPLMEEDEFFDLIMSEVVEEEYETGAVEAEKAITLLDAASGKVSSERSKFGAYMNVLEHVQNNTGAYKESLKAAESRVRDTDIAKMSITLTRNQLILQVAQSVTSQANQMNQGILELLK